MPFQPFTAIPLANDSSTQATHAVTSEGTNNASRHARLRFGLSVFKATPMPRTLWRKSLCGLLAFSLLGGSFASALPGFADPDVISGGVGLYVHPANLQEAPPVLGANRAVTMSFRDVDIADALRALAKKGGFSVLVDDSVTGNITVDLNNVSIQNALNTFRTYGHLSYNVQGNTLMVAKADSEKGRSYQKSTTRIFHLKNANARTVSDFLNQTIFADRNNANGVSTSGGSSSSGGSGGGNSVSGPVGLVVTPDFNTNSIVVVGTPADMQIVAEHLEALDQPRQMRTWRLSQANALDVATILSSSLFNEGQSAVTTSGGTSSSSSGNDTLQPSTMRVTADNVQEGNGTSQASQSGSAGGSSGGSVSSSVTLRARVKQAQTIQVSPNGPLIIPDTRVNTITLLGTAEQIAMAESLIPTLDRKMPQVVLEASLIEVSERNARELGYNMGSNSGYFSSGSNNVATATGVALKNSISASGAIGRNTSSSNPLESILQFSTRPATVTRNFAYQLNALVSQNKAKILANPTIVSTSDNETIISIVDEIIKSVSITVGTNSAAAGGGGGGGGGLPASTTATDNIGEAGIVLNILPHVGADRTVSLRVRPVVSSIASVQLDRFGNEVTLLSKREILAQNSVLHDGESFVLGGLIQDTNTKVVARNPMLSNLPIVGALARNSTSNKNRTELVVMITPHIINDESNVAPGTAGIPSSQRVPATILSESHQNNGMVPVSLNGPNRPSSLPPLEKVHTLGNGASAMPTQRYPVRPPAYAYTMLQVPHTDATPPADSSNDVPTLRPSASDSVTPKRAKKTTKLKRDDWEHPIVQMPGE